MAAPSRFVQELASRLSIDIDSDLGESGSRRSLGESFVRPSPVRVKALGRILRAVSARDTVREAMDDESGEYVSQTDLDPQSGDKKATDSVKEAMLHGFRAGISVPVMMSIIENRKVYPATESHEEMFDSIISSIYRRLGPAFAEEKLVDIYARGPKAVLYIRENSKETMSQVASALDHLGKVFDLGYDESTGTYRIRLETEMDIGDRDLTKGKQTPRSTKDGTETPQSQQDHGAGTKSKLTNQNKANRSSDSFVHGKSDQTNSGRAIGETVVKHFSRGLSITKVPALGDIWRKSESDQKRDATRVAVELEKLISRNTWRSLPSEKKAAVLHTAYEKAGVPVIPKHEFISACGRHKLLEFGFGRDDDDSSDARNPGDPPDLGGDDAIGTTSPDDGGMDMGADAGGMGGEGGIAAGSKVKTPDGNAGIVIDPGVGGGDATVGIINFDIDTVPSDELELVGEPDADGDSAMMPEEPGPRDMDAEPEAPEGEMGDDDKPPFGDGGDNGDEEDDEEKGEAYKDYMTTHALGDVTRHPEQHHEKGDGFPTRSRRGADQSYGGADVNEDGTQTGTGSPANSTKGTGISSHDTELDNRVNSLFDIEGEQFSSGTDTASDHSQKEPGDTDNRSKDVSADEGPYESVRRAKRIIASPDAVVEGLTGANSALKSLGFRPMSEVEYRHVMDLHAAGWLPDKIMDFISLPREAIEAITNAETPEGANRGGTTKDQINLGKDLTGY